MPQSPNLPSGNFVVKIASRCNINCSYCYMYNMGDLTFLSRPRVMDTHVAEAALARINDYSLGLSGLPVTLVLHGGEPLLAGKKWVDWFLCKADDVLGGRLTCVIQTNGVLLDADWLSLFSEHNVRVGVSIDGPAEVHNRYRVDHRGRGTYSAVRKGIELLAEGSADGRIKFGILCVANPEYSAADVFRHFTSLDIYQMDFLWPDYNHDNKPPYDPGNLGRYFIELFEAWYTTARQEISIRWFLSSMLLFLGGDSLMEGIGGGPVASVAIETDGGLQPLDTLRVCGNGFTDLGYSVLGNTIEDLRQTPLFQECLAADASMHDTCRRCQYVSVCGGGYLPHRYGRDRRFNNESVHCSDIQMVLGHVRSRMQNELPEMTQRGIVRLA